MKCKKCKAEIPNISVFCPNCGERTNKKKEKTVLYRKCPECNVIISTTKINYCPKCSKELGKIKT